MGVLNYLNYHITFVLGTQETVCVFQKQDTNQSVSRSLVIHTKKTGGVQVEPWSADNSGIGS